MANKRKTAGPTIALAQFAASLPPNTAAAPASSSSAIACSNSPSNLALYRFGARLWIARIMITWGLLSIAMVFIGGRGAFTSCGFCSASPEAGFFPGVAF